MPEIIKVNVVEKVATVLGAPVIICGNSDYIIDFTFDTEWETLNFKTARFLYKKGDKLQHVDVVFTGSAVAAPILSNVEEVYLGVYAGGLRTTTPARILCAKSILCGDSEVPADPPEDVYKQLLEAIDNLDTLPTVDEGEAGRALMVNEDGRWAVRLPDFMHDQNTKGLIRFFFGTQEEWDAWDGDKNGVLFVPTNDTTLEDTLAAAEGAVKAVEELTTKLTDGTFTVKNASLAGHANSAGSANTAKSADRAGTAGTAECATKDGVGNNIAATYTRFHQLNFTPAQSVEVRLDYPGSLLFLVSTKRADSAVRYSTAFYVMAGASETSTVAGIGELRLQYTLDDAITLDATLSLSNDQFVIEDALVAYL